MLLTAETTKRIYEEIPANSKFWLAPGDLLIQRANTLEYVGTAAIYDGPPRSYVYPDLMMRVRLRAPVNTSFVWRYLNSEPCKSYFRANATGTAGNMPKINGKTLQATPIPLAPINEQQRIVDKLDALTARSRRAREALDAIPPLLERFRQSVLAAAFRGHLTADWRAQNPDVEPAEELIERIRAERRRRWEEDYLAKLRAKGKAPANEKWKSAYENAAPHAGKEPWVLPASWAWVSIEDVADVLLGRQRAPQYLTGKHTKPYLRVANVSDRGIDFDDLNEMDFNEADFRKYRLRTGDILMSEGQSPELVGESAVYDRGIEDLCFQKTLHRLRPYPSASSSALMCFAFRCLRRQGVFRQYASLTTSIAHLTLARVKRVPFPLPPAAEQKVLERRLVAAWGTIDRIEALLDPARERLTDLDRGLLAKAFRGELVSQDPRDEPATALLERICEGAPATRGARRRADGRRDEAMLDA